MSYTAKVIESSKELTAKEKVLLKDMSDVTMLDDIVTPEQGVIIDIDFTATVSVHNDMVKDGDPDYNKYVYVDKSGERYVSGSESLHRQYADIAEEMENENEPWGIKVIKKESSNYKGKFFLTCVIV